MVIIHSNLRIVFRTKLFSFYWPTKVMIYLSHEMLFLFVIWQQNFGVQWCRGMIKDKIFTPWLESMKASGCKFLENRKLSDFVFDSDCGCQRISLTWNLDTIRATWKVRTDTEYMISDISNLLAPIINSQPETWIRLCLS